MIRIFGLAIAFSVCFAGAAQGATIFFAIDPLQTFLRQDPDDPALAPLIVDLSALGIAPGDQIGLEQVGDFSFCLPMGCADEGTRLIGLFSSTNTLLAQSFLARVPGAIDAGPDTVTEDLFSGIPTDIPQDFEIFGNTVTVPIGAAFLFAGVHDPFVGDNGDPDQDFGLTITTTTAIPEPTSLVLLGTGAAAVLARRRNHGHKASLQKRPSRRDG